MKELIKFLKKVIKRKENLDWICQHTTFHRKDDEGRVVHFARSKVGIFEIYDDFSDKYLLLYPKQLNLPADLYFCLNEAKEKACEVYNQST